MSGECESRQQTALSIQPLNRIGLERIVSGNDLSRGAAQSLMSYTFVRG